MPNTPKISDNPQAVAMLKEMGGRYLHAKDYDQRTMDGKFALGLHLAIRAAVKAALEWKRSDHA